MISRPMVHRVEVVSSEASDPESASAESKLREGGLQFSATGAGTRAVTYSSIYLIESDEPSEKVLSACSKLLADPVNQRLKHKNEADAAGAIRLEVHLKPGVMDPVAATTEMALRQLGIRVKQVRTGRAYLLAGVNANEAGEVISKALASGVIETLHHGKYAPKAFAQAALHDNKLRHVAVRNLTDEELLKLSRQGHLFLNLEEMKAVQAYFKQAGREPTDLELETLAQTWSEHCVHKTLKSAVNVQEQDETGKVVSHRSYKNLIKETIFGATQQLMKSGKGEFCLSVFKDNAGVIAFDETDGVCMKVETHNRPSAIDPYGGSATGAGGVIRDVLGTGLGAKPIANTDVFCVAYPDAAAPKRTYSQLAELPKGVIHPKRILQQVVAGVRDYGNRMGIPTVNGAVYFDDKYVGNPLVYCGCVGLIPRNKVSKAAKAGDAIVVMGGRTGRDGIHGATFSSAELTTTHTDEFAHAVQIGNAITEKKVTDVVLAARDAGLFTAITDCGAGGLSSAVGEMGAELGAEVHLERVPLKYEGLRYDEIWISEAQERMVLAVPQQHVAALLKLAAQEDVEATVIGTFGTEGHVLKVHYAGTAVGELPMAFVHDGLPMPTRKAVVSAGQNWQSASLASDPAKQFAHLGVQDRLLASLKHPQIASKHWIVRQYDHEVQGATVIKPAAGPMELSASDAAVLRPKLNTFKGIALSVGLAPHVSDPYAMAIAAIDEALRNVICVGADFQQASILDNFCWPGTDDELAMGTLVRTAEACRDASLALGVPFISGKDSLHNQFTDKATGKVIRIPGTLLISSMAIVPDVRKCLTPDLKRPGSLLTLVTAKDAGLIPSLEDLALVHREISKELSRGEISAAHDVSDCGLLVAAAEMAMASTQFGLNFLITSTSTLFDERLGSYLIEVPLEHSRSVFARLSDAGLMPAVVADVTTDGRIVVPGTDPFLPPAADVSVADCRKAFLGTLDW